MLVVEHLTKMYGGLVAVNDFSFEVKEGEIVGLIGPNGSGKTVTFEVISGFDRPTSGTISLKGERIDCLLPYQVLGKGLARSFQVVQTFERMTAYETILLAALHRLPMKEARKRTEEILDLIGLTARSHRPAPKLTLPDHKALELGKVLATSPQMVLLDEVMAGLTEPEARVVMENIRDMRRRQGLTFLVVEHHMELLNDLCDRIIALSFGKKIFEGTPNEVATNKAVIEAYLGAEVSLD